MTAKQYLKQAYRLNELINSDLEELKQLKALSTSISSLSLSGVISSGTRNSDASFVNCINKIVNLEEKINTEIDSYVDLKEEIRQKIIALDDKNEILILQERYLLFTTWEKIADNMNFTPQWIYELHKKALKSFSKKYNF